MASASLSFLSCFSRVASTRSLSRSFETQVDITDLLFGDSHLLAKAFASHSLQAQGQLYCLLVEHLPQVCTAMTIIPSTAKEKKKLTKTNFIGLFWLHYTTKIYYFFYYDHLSVFGGMFINCFLSFLGKVSLFPRLISNSWAQAILLSQPTQISGVICMHHQA